MIEEDYIRLCDMHSKEWVDKHFKRCVHWLFNTFKNKRL